MSNTNVEKRVEEESITIGDPIGEDDKFIKVSTEKDIKDDSSVSEEEEKYSNFAPCLSSFADYFGLGALTPLIPFFVENLGEDSKWVGYILTAQYGGVILGSTIVGVASDRIGRKKTMVIALTGDVIFFTLTGFVTSVRMMLIIRFIAGVFTPLAASIAWVNDVAGDDVQKRAVGMGQWALSCSTGFMVGSAAAGLLGSANFEIVNCLCGALALAGLYVTHVAISPPHNHAEKPSGIRKMVTSKEFRGLAVSYFVLGLQFTGLTTLFGVMLLELYNYAEWQVSAWLISLSVVHFCQFKALPFLAARFQAANVISAGYVFACFSHIFLLFSFSYTSGSSSAALFLVSSTCIPIALAFGNIIAPTIADKYATNARGACVGMLRTIFNIGQAAGPTYGVLLFNEDAEAPGRMFFLVQGVMLLIAATVLQIVFNVGVVGEGDEEWKEEEEGGGLEKKEKKKRGSSGSEGASEGADENI